MKKTKQLVTKNMLMSEVVERFPELVEVLTYDYGLHCVSCFAAEMETLEQGASGHGMSEEEVGVMISSLNKIITETKVKAES